MTVQIFVYKLLFTIAFFQKMKKTSRNLSHFEKELHFENERTSNDTKNQLQRALKSKLVRTTYNLCQQL